MLLKNTINCFLIVLSLKLNILHKRTVSGSISGIGNNFTYIKFQSILGIHPRIKSLVGSEQYIRSYVSICIVSKSLSLVMALKMVNAF